MVIRAYLADIVSKMNKEPITPRKPNNITCYYDIIFELSNKNWNFGKYIHWSGLMRSLMILINLTFLYWKVKCVNIVKICIVNHCFPNFQCLVLQKSCRSARSIQSTHRPVDVNVTGCKKILWRAFRFHIAANI